MLPELWLPKASAVGMALAWLVFLLGPRGRRGVTLLLPAAVALMAVALGLRWERLGHGPFFNLYEILGSSFFSLGMIYSLAWWRWRDLRASAHLVLPVLVLLGVWQWVTPPLDTHFMPTYKTGWLWVHLVFGKLFLGILVTAVGIAGIIVLRRGLGAFGEAPSDAQLDACAWVLLRWALVFETLMLIAGAVWAQDAWGRYWAWDPLETSAFLTWLALLAALHARMSFRLGPMATPWMAAGVFVLAFLTFFGMPFISQAPHQGAL